VACCAAAGFVPAAHAASWCGTDAVGADREPEAVSARQVHVIYAFPLDGTDRFASSAGPIVSDIGAIDAWWRNQDPSRAPRFDLFAFPGCPPGIGQLDLARVQLPHDTAWYRPLETRWGRIAADLSGPPSAFADPDKKYLVYYDGIVDQPRVCGISTLGPFSGGASAYSQVYLGSSCPQDLGAGGFLATAAAHELTHNLGALVFPGPLHACSNDPAHPCDSDTDLMYPILRHPLAEEVLDFGHDDYYAHSGSWFDVQDSEWLAHVSSPQWPLAVSISGSGAGTVASDLPGIACPGACAIPWDDASVVTLTEEPGPNTRFVGWAGACTGTDACEMTMDAAKTVEARFALQVPLRVRVKGAGAVASKPAGIACPSTCTGDFDQAAIVRLTAKARPGSKFAGWTGACTGRGACTVRLAGSRTVSAIFRKR
jgi:Divergent InlB B-repeat domain